MWIGIVVVIAEPLMEICPGTHLLRSFLTAEEQRSLMEDCVRAGDRPAGFYVPTVRGGGKMKLRMVCLGKHWNPLTYRYEARRSDYDGKEVQEVPASWSALARRAARCVGMSIDPGICILNHYSVAGRLGLHRDKDESRATIEAGVPVVSLSLGCAARFLLGGLRRREPLIRLELRSGDALVMGGPSRLRYHGVAGILPQTAPGSMPVDGRMSLTFREF